MRKVEYGGIRDEIGHEEKTITWNNGRRTVKFSKVGVNRKTGELVRLTKSSSVNIGGILKIIGLLFLIAALFAFFYDFSLPTFSSFLEMLQTAPEFMSFETLKELFSVDIDSAPLPDFIKDLAEVGRGLIAIISLVVNSIIDSFKLVAHVFTWVLGG